MIFFKLVVAIFYKITGWRNPCGCFYFGKAAFIPRLPQHQHLDTQQHRHFRLLINLRGKDFSHQVHTGRSSFVVHINGNQHKTTQANCQPYDIDNRKAPVL